MADAVHLSQRLALSAFIYQQIGMSFPKLKALLSETSGGTFDGVSCYASTLRNQSSLRLGQEQLLRYDRNILEALAKINHKRTLPFELKYYQYLAALATEVFLDLLQRDRAALVQQVNRFVLAENMTRSPAEAYPSFAGNDLDKIAFWMATGSGKTLLLHLNYHQYLLYFPDTPQNILLITPNEGLSAQHEHELQQSNIPCERWRGPSTTVNPLRDPHTVTIIEITKLNPAKKSKRGASVDSASFSKPNLLFVDEGHKGSTGDAWKNVRTLLGEGGFTFEYSATFGQAVSTGRAKEGLLDEYSKAIIFDYSYKYFYDDGYGKDYAIYNLPDGFDDRLQDMLLLGNLLTFYAQRRAFDTHHHALAEYGIEAPLWIFVGSSVNAVAKDNGQVRSDVLDVVRFLQRIVNDRAWTVERIERILAGDSGLRSDGYDLFAGRWAELQALGSATAIYADLLQRLFHTRTSAGLRLVELTQADGEIALYAGTAAQPFGLINIGDARAFRDLVERANVDVTVSTDRFGSSLFGAIKQPASPINVLIGAKKFIEGWNSWRVSSMSLLNIGKNEGSQIIQLFGRGVRLKGYHGSLQRSHRADAPAPPLALSAPLRRLETLAIFGIRADYMQAFQEYLQAEEILTEPLREIDIPVRPSHAMVYPSLHVPTLRDDASFEEQVLIELQPDASLARVKVDVREEVHVLWSDMPGRYGVMQEDKVHQFDDRELGLFNWQRLALELHAHRQKKAYSNLHFTVDALREVLQDHAVYDIIGPATLLQIQSPADLRRVEKLAGMVLQKYADQYYKQRKLQWEGQQLRYRTLDTLPDLIPPSYAVQIKASDTQVLAQITTLLAGDDLYTTEPEHFPSVHHERHLYQPLLTKNGPLVKIKPDVAGLGPSEHAFVRDLRVFLHQQPHLLAGRELYLLRNLSRGKGIGFFETRGSIPISSCGSLHRANSMWCLSIRKASTTNWRSSPTKKCCCTNASNSTKLPYDRTAARIFSSTPSSTRSPSTSICHGRVPMGTAACVAQRALNSLHITFCFRKTDRTGSHTCLQRWE